MEDACYGETPLPGYSKGESSRTSHAIGTLFVFSTQSVDIWRLLRKFIGFYDVIPGKRTNCYVYCLNFN